MNWRDSERKGQEILAERLAGWQEQYPDVRIERSLLCDQPSDARRAAQPHVSR
jgi:hypothetical protein